MTTHNPRSICLRPHEVRRLLDAGRVTLVRPVSLKVVGFKPTWVGWSEDHDDGPGWYAHDVDGGQFEPAECWNETKLRCPFGSIGTRLFGREKFGIDTNGSCQWVVYGDMTRGPDCSDYISHDEAVKRGTPWNGFDWRSAATMPKWASRLALETAAVRVKRCYDISSTDAANAGIPDHGYEDYIDRHYGGAWQRNAWLWLGDVRRVN